MAALSQRDLATGVRLKDGVVRAILAGSVALVVFAFAVAKGMQDPDFFFHAATGRLILETGQVPSTDPFSFTWQGQPWTPHEWLGGVLLHLLDVAIGPTGTTVVYGLVGAATVALPIVFLDAVRPGAVAAAALLSGLTLTPQLTLRPQALSWFLVSALLVVLLRTRDRRVFLLLPLFLLWANLHGLYVVGLGILAVFTVFSLAERTALSGRTMLLVTLGCTFATLVTPAGLEGLTYPLRYLEPNDWGLANIPEWRSPDFHEPAHWLYAGIMVLLLVMGTGQAPGWLVTVTVLGLLGGLFAMRGIPVAAVVTLPTLAFGIDARTRGWSLDAPRRAMTLVVCAGLAVTTALVMIPKPLDDAVTRHRETRFPVAAVDELASMMPDARIFAQYFWGGYVAHRLHESGGTVFVDGRNDMFDQDILEEYSAAVAADVGWQSTMDTHRVDAILLPPERFPLLEAAQRANWCERFRSDVAVLLMKCDTSLR
jgi:hypothetical protein